MKLNTLILIFLGCGCGGVLRYSITNCSCFLLGRGFPGGTLLVNVLGSFLIGLLFVVFLNHFLNLSASLRAFFLVGLLGGFTTVSSFSLETLALFENGEMFYGALNIGFTASFCVLAAWLGVVLGKHI